MAQLYDANRPPSALPPIVAAAANLPDASHSAASTADQDYPITNSEPRPVPSSVGITRSQFTAEPQQVHVRESMVAGIAPEEARYAPAAAPKTATVKTAAPAAAPIAMVEISSGSAIAGGTVEAPVVTLPTNTPNVSVETPYAIADSVRKFAESKGVDLSLVTASKGGKITKKDVEAAIAASSAASNTAPTIAALPAPESVELGVLTAVSVPEPAIESDTAAVALAEVPTADPAVADAPVTGGTGSNYDVSAAARGANGPTGPAPMLTVVQNAPETRAPAEVPVALANPAPVVLAEIAPAAAPAAAPVAAAVAEAPVLAPVSAPTAASAAVEAPAPVPAPAAIKDPEPVPALAAATAGTAVHRIRINLDGDQERAVEPIENYLELAARAYPGLHFISGSLSMSAKGLFLVAVTASEGLVVL